MRWFIALPMLALLTGMAGAQGSERERLAAERQTLQDRFAAEERACRERFAVTACVDELGLRRRAALAPLRERELAIDDAERQQRASDRQAARALRAARPQPASGATSMPGLEPETAVPRQPPALKATVREPDPPRADGKQTSRALQAAERARAAAKRAEVLDAAQADLARKNAERAASGKAGLPLPVPPAASAAWR